VAVYDCKFALVQLVVSMLRFPSFLIFVYYYVNRLKSAEVADERVKVMNEIISGMRLIKMYAWEWTFHEYVKKIRK